MSGLPATLLETGDPVVGIWFGLVVLWLAPNGGAPISATLR